MKESLLVIVCLLSFSVSILAQTSETFDIVTFQPPKGFSQQAADGAVQFATEDKAKGNYCLVTLFKSVPAVGSSKENFAGAWQALVQDTLKIPAAPQEFPSNNKEDWQLEGGYASFEKDGEKGVVLLYTISGYRKMVNIVVLTNSLDYEKPLTAFIESISLKTAEPSSPQTEPKANASSIIGTWGIASSGQSNFEVNHGLSGYIKRHYTFKPDGTYEFLIKTFTYTSRQLLFTKETGTYVLSGNSLTIIPQKSVIQAWSKATVIGSDGRRSETDNWGNLISTQNRRLERVTYQISKHYFSGIQKLSLLMQASTPTERDGPFNGGSSFPNTWIYQPESYPIKPPE